MESHLHDAFTGDVDKLDVATVRLHGWANQVEEPLDLIAQGAIRGEIILLFGHCAIVGRMADVSDPGVARGFCALPRPKTWFVYTAAMKRSLGCVFLCAWVAGCASDLRVGDPRAALADTHALPRTQIAAMEALDESPDEQYLEQLHGLIWKPGYTPQVRLAAFERLERHDLEGLRRTIRQRLPQLTAYEWLQDLCAMIADRGWAELTPALVSSWARPSPFISDDDRPEQHALASLHGEDRLTDLIFRLFVDEASVHNQGLRTRCWELMHRLGERQRLLDLVASTGPTTDDLMLHDIRAGAVELGIVPRNREEILWLRQLRMPERAGFWQEASSALSHMGESRRSALELRDLAIVVAAWRHEPELLQAPESDLHARLAAYLRAQRHHDAASNYGAMRGRPERLHAWRDDLTWGDLAAMLMAVRAMQVPQIVEHLFDYAERDRIDTTTEYGGVIRLDERGRFELLEFPPRIRRHGNMFIAPQEMFDAGYTALFHFHNHAQRHHNAQNAGPGFGDMQYADNTRANCLVFTFITRDTLNVDFYRHGRVAIDLGEVRRR
jgi:hypothetical protein